MVQNARVSSDYKSFDRPTVLRNEGTEDTAGKAGQDPDYLDIPAFLRRQAD